MASTAQLSVAAQTIAAEQNRNLHGDAGVVPRRAAHRQQAGGFGEDRLDDARTSGVDREPARIAANLDSTNRSARACSRGRERGKGTVGKLLQRHACSTPTCAVLMQARFAARRHQGESEEVHQLENLLTACHEAQGAHRLVRLSDPLLRPRGAAAQSPSVEQIRAIDSIWTRSYFTHDTVAAMSVLRPDIFITSTNGSFKNRDAELNDVRDIGHDGQLLPQHRRDRASLPGDCRGHGTARMGDDHGRSRFCRAPSL